MIATYETDTMANVLLGAKEKLGIEGTTTHDAKLIRFGREALNLLPSFRLGETKIETLKICDFKTQLPCDFVRIIEPNGLRYRFSDSCYYPLAINGITFQNDGRYSCAGNVQMANGWIYFDNTILADEVDILYLAVNKDENGRLIIPASHSPAMQEYMCYFFYRSIGERALASDSRYRWGDLRKKVKADSNKENANEFWVICNIMNSFI